MIDVIFVCTGNICRSPSGEGIFKSIVKEAGMEDKFFIDSAGTTAYHVGEKADARMQKHAEKRNIFLTSLSRMFTTADFTKFDYILAMDFDNLHDLQRLDSRGIYKDKIYLMNDFSAEHKGQNVPDPYYGGAAGFEQVLDMLEDSCRGLLESLEIKYGL